MSAAHPSTSLDSRLFSIGLTGGIGCGKSLVADLFQARGASVIDTDQIAHALTTANGLAMPAIRTEFGAVFIAADGSLNRNAMREHVFTNPTARLALEAILHPMIAAQTQLAAQEARGAYLIFVVPLLVESGKWRDRVDRILVVDCSENLQRERVMRRNHLTGKQVTDIMQAQATRAARQAVADDIITNESELGVLESQVEELHNLYLTLSMKK
jgi:dephospho-CoA kinase